MSRRFLITASWCALLCCAASGCYPHHQYPYGGTYPGPYGAPGPYQQMPPGTVVPEGSIPPGNYPIQPELGQPVPPPQGALPSNGSQALNNSYPGNTNYDGVDTQWKQPLNNPSGSDMNAPFDANSTASGRNTNPSGGFSSPSDSQPVPSYQDPNRIPSSNPPVDNTFPQNSSQPPQSDPFPAESNDQFQSNKNPQPVGNNTQMNDQFGSSSNDQFPGNEPQQFPEANNQLQENSDSGFSVPSPVQQQSFESGADTFEANPPKFNANQSVPDDTFNQNSVDSSQEFQPPVQSFPGNENTFPENQNNSFPGNQDNPFPGNGNDDTFGPNSSSTMRPSQGKVSHADHQMPVSGPQLVRSEQFMTPAKFQPASFEFPSEGGASPAKGQAPSPFSYDRQNYRWLRGIVEFDEQEKSWNITYNATPDRTDKFGGNIVLLDQGKLNRFKNGDVVLIDGHIDGSRQDRMGKPCYFVTKAQRLVPKR
ncbi:hypothetical protein Pan153_51040 [Gimesia panareensis]|uniref:Uncharacterized protein n=1 Tax=Gimesia panareensis TaxID=2527978 RepID=A0A518FVQ6_9PLAN|nr:hypothetical protein [Gimesia panareensis]QDV20429.1 hypothetical protein Pan153_51040 [Gimesia panareensis]